MLFEGLDCGFEHPTFAVLEADHDASGDDGGRRVTRYMLDMGLNHMVRKNPTPVSQTAHRLICVPGGGEGAGGCLVCEEGRLVWIEGPSPETPDAAPKMVAAAFPVRQGGHGRLMTVAHATHRQKNRYFFLLQLESGDVFKVTLDSGDNIAAAPRRLVILYFDTLAPCSSLAILRNGFLFAASSAAQHHMYQFLSLGDESSGVWCDADTKSPPTFVARPLVNLTESARLDCLGPMQGFIVTDIHTQGSGAPQIYAASGRGPQGCALSILRHGLQVSALAQQQLPGVPEAVWTLRGSGGGQHTHIVLSFANGTLTLGVEPSGSVREVPESECNILTGVPSLLIARVDNDVLQVTGIMLRHIRGQQRVSVWNPPPKQRITHAAYSGRQVAVALSGGEIIYFELDAQSGTLLELERHDSGSQVVALTMAPPPAAGVTRSKWLAYCDTDNRLRILSLAPTGLLQRVAVQQLSAQPSSLVMSFLHRSGTGAGSSPPALFVFVGTKSGLLLRTSVDVATGALGDTRSRFLGVRPVRIFSIVVAPENNTGVPTEVDNALLAVGDRPWLVFNRQQQLLTMPLSCPPFQSAASFASLVEPHGWVVLDHDQLRVVTVVPTVDPFTCHSLPLVYTPRKQAVHSASGLVVVAQSQANVEPVVPRADAPSFVPHSAPLLEQITQRRVVGVCPETDFTRDDQYSAAAISFIDPFADSGRGAVAFSGELVGGGSVTCMCTVKFESSKTEMLCVGVSRNQRLLPTPKNAGGRIFLFSVVRESGGHAVSVKLEQVTDTKEAPTAMAQYNSMLLCALGTKLRIYDLGKKQLLKKCERKNLGRQLVAITVMGNRFVVADSSDSVFWCFYEVTRNLIRVFCDDVIPRHVSAMCALDYNTIAVGDKFGCVSVSRIPDAVNEALRLDAGGADLWPQQLQGAPWKCDEVARFKVDGSVTALSTTSLLGPTGATDPVLLYSTIHGAIGALLPLTSREDVDFLSKLEVSLFFFFFFRFCFYRATTRVDIFSSFFPG